jgi:transglutaminase-like putative cysteine protease
MKLHVSAVLDYHFPQSCEVLLKVEAARSPDQAVLAETLRLSPKIEMTRLDDSASGERRVSFITEGDLTISYAATVEPLVRESGFEDAPQPHLADLPPEALDYLIPSRFCPSDRFQPMVEQEFGKLTGGPKVRAILDWVAGHLEYRPGVSNSYTTADDTFLDRAGVCRDYSHLTITLCRAADIPARAVSAYAWRLKPPDFHAVVEVWLAGRWWLIDPTNLAPIEGLVRIASGRDAADLAFMTVFGHAQMVNQTVKVRKAG